MANTQNQAANATVANAAVQSENAQVNNTNVQQNDAAQDLFMQFVQGDLNTQADSFEQTVRTLLADTAHCRLFKGLEVSNVTVTFKDTHVFVALTTLGALAGNVAGTELDAFGQPVMVIGGTSIVSTSLFALHAVAKRNPKTALIATKLNSDNLDEVREAVENLFIGATIDVLVQIVEANAEYKNPFARNPQPTSWTSNHAVQHVVKLIPGDVQNEAYRARFVH